MQKIIIKCTWIFSFCVLFSCNAHIYKTPIVDELESIKTTLTIKDIREIWFWFLAKKGVDPDDFLIAFISLEYADNPEMSKIIWPEKLINHDLKYLIKSIESANQPKAKQEQKPIQ